MKEKLLENFLINQAYILFLKIKNFSNFEYDLIGTSSKSGF